MKNGEIHLNLKDLPAALATRGRRLLPYVPIIFFLVVAVVYGFLLYRIGNLSNAQPDQSEVSSEISQLSPHIDQNAAKQLQSLEDHSVNVQTLFNQARNNPFGE